MTRKYSAFTIKSPPIVADSVVGLDSAAVPSNQKNISIPLTNFALLGVDNPTGNLTLTAGSIGIGVTPTERFEIFGNIKIREFGNFQLDLGAQDNNVEGGQIIFRGGGNSGSPFDDWIQDIFFDTMRIFTTSTTPETFKVFNAGAGSQSFINAIFDGKIHVGSEAAPTHTMDIHGTLGQIALTSSGDITTDDDHVMYALLDTSAVRTVNIATVDNILDRVIRISDRGGQAGTNNVTITPVSPALINGVASLTTGIVANYGGVSIQSDGTNWFTL